MLFLPASHPPRRAITAVLALWLCVVAAGVWAPMARAHMAAQGVERLCSGGMAPLWALNPAADAAQGDVAALHHVMDCPLCLPLLAPPPSAHTTPLPASAHAVPQSHRVGAHMAQPGQWPLARGPPDATHFLA